MAWCQTGLMSFSFHFRSWHHATTITTSRRSLSGTIIQISPVGLTTQQTRHGKRIVGEWSRDTAEFPATSTQNLSHGTYVGEDFPPVPAKLASKSCHGDFIEMHMGEFLSEFWSIPKEEDGNAKFDGGRH